MRINKLSLDYFLAHVNYTATYADGLNVLRGANERGKSASLEGLAYCLVGTDALVGTKAETVNDTAPNDNGLNSLVEFEHEGVVYECQRSFKGAELKKDGKIICTGQDTVTVHVKELLGLPARNDAHELIFANQNKIRGALALGPTAASEFIEKLANFEEVDNLIKFLVAKLPNGSTKILEEAVATGQAKLDELTSLPEIDPAIHDAEIVQLGAQVQTLQTSMQGLQSQKQALEGTKAAALARVAALTPQIAALDSQLKSKTSAKAGLEETIRNAAAEQAEVVTIEKQLVKALDYDIYRSLPTAPEDVWDDTLESLEDEIAAALAEQTTLQETITSAAAQIRLLNSQRAKGGNCPTCGKAYSDPNEVCRINEDLDKQVAKLNLDKAAAQASLSESQGYAGQLIEIKSRFKLVAAWAEQYATYVTIDKSVIPWALTWAGAVPDQIDKALLEKRYGELREKIKAAAAAPGKLAVLESEVTSLQQQLAEKKKEKDEAMVDTAVDAQIVELQRQLAPLQTEHSQSVQSKGKLEQQRAVLVAQKAAAEASLASAASALQTAQQSLQEQRENNVLIKTVKDARILVSAQLWQTVLGAASYYFSALRGKVSHVIREKGAFKVQGERGRLSGSTLDVLGLALRIVISKMFCRARLMALDEPSAGCDQIRTAAMVGTLLGAEFEQIILVTHNDLVEAGAANVIEI